ncbi:hypothetical protein [Rubellimicrobium aerolatum]|uniref:Uncharacterized protein n=1 Tax=Rubellimicrobium aerolatum TaxID=490979 RepID=A0ABW0SDK2_9RHOB|nr:hypothetical protein [Rubellimicrobium aerolatum]MBP1805768.1 hypothetical protein [Rubellimicrobium aerolatum]
MTVITFARLQDLPPREARSHEEHVFTPWPADNLDHLAEAIRIPLELTGREAPVDGLWADILARNPQDGSVVLIKSRPEVTDHIHPPELALVSPDTQAVAVWAAMNSRGERIFSPECGWRGQRPSARCSFECRTGWPWVTRPRV